MSRQMSLDVGTKTVGVAVSDPLGMFAQPVETIARTGRKADVARIRALADQYTPVRIVIGLPIGTDGSEMSSAEEARRMALAVARVVECEVVLVDERFTTAQAERVLIAGGMRRKKRKKVIDQAAAVLILQQWLDGPIGGEVVTPEPGASPRGASAKESE